LTFKIPKSQYITNKAARMHNFTNLIVLFQNELPILLAVYSLVLLLLSVITLLFFYKIIFLLELSKVLFVLKEVTLQISSLNLKCKYWFLDQYRLPFQCISQLNLLLEHIIFRRKTLFPYPFLG
jgi:hypothetical protein